MDALVNRPTVDDFMKAIPLEAAHARQRWGETHDAIKAPEEWYWLVGYLAGKALRSTIDGDIDKALHHTISTAGALANWHAMMIELRPTSPDSGEA